jgi:hypothetical protein
MALISLTVAAIHRGKPDVPPRPARRQPAKAEPVDYTLGGRPSPAERQALAERRDLNGISPHVRRDRMRLGRDIAARNRGEDDLSDMTSWENLAAMREVYDGKADFHPPKMGFQQRVNWLGQSVPRQRRDRGERRCTTTWTIGYADSNG